MDDIKKADRKRLRLVEGLPSRRSGMTSEEMARDCRLSESAANRARRWSEARVWAELAELAEDLASREREIGYARRTLTEDEALRERARLESVWRLQRVGLGVLLGLALFGLCLLMSGCASDVLARGTVQLYGGAARPTAAGRNDLSDLGSYPVVGLESVSGRGEAWLELGRARGEVDAGDLGIFDLDASIVRAGVGMRLGTARLLGLDWTLSAGACVAVATGEASAGPDLRTRVKESGAGVYGALEAARGPFFLRARYVDGPSVDVGGYTTDLGGPDVVGGIRWDL